MAEKIISEAEGQKELAGKIKALEKAETGLELCRKKLERQRTEKAKREKEVDDFRRAMSNLLEDMTATKNTLEYANKYTTNIIKSMPDSLIVINPNTTIRTVNPAALRLLGYEEKELIGQPVRKLFEEEEEEEDQSTHSAIDLQAMPLKRKVIRRLIKHGSVSNVETIYRAKDGTAIPVLFSGSVMRDKRGTIQGIVCVGLDITERKKMEESLREGERWLRIITDAAPLLISFVDTEERYQYVNRKYEELFHRPRASFIGRHVKDVLGSENYHRISEHIQKALAGEPQHFQIRTRMPDGKLRYLDAVYAPQQDAKLGPRGFMAAVSDITERKHLEESLHRSEKMSAVGQLAAGVAHEINNPLGIILFFAQSAVKKIKENDLLALPLKSIEREALRCKNLVQDLLVFSRHDQKRVVEYDLNEAVNGALSLVEAHARIQSFEVNKELGRVEKLWGDKNQVQQIIVNLCSNAMDAMPEGGSLGVMTRMLDTASGPAARIEVSDTGKGIPENIQNKLFEPFFTTKEVGKGTGLGLSLVYEMVQRHGGKIDFESQEDRGTTFRITLPIKAGGEDLISPQDSLRGSVLIIDDDKAARRMIHKVLRRLWPEADIHEAGDGFDAGQKVATLLPFLVVLDLNLPGVNGVDICRSIRSDERLKQTRVLAITGHAIEESKLEVLEAGADAFLAKPLELQPLRSCLERLLKTGKGIKEGHGKG